MTLLSLALLQAYASAPPDHARVTSVYDGDTLTLSSGEKVRLLWVNTPELRPAEAFGVEAGDWTRSQTNGREVELVYEATPMDGYGRLLAAVKVDGEWLAIQLLERGLGHLYLIPPVSSETRAPRTS